MGIQLLNFITIIIIAISVVITSYSIYSIRDRLDAIECEILQECEDERR